MQRDLRNDSERRAQLEPSTATFYGKFLGVVKDNRDRRGRGRLLVRVPQVLGEQELWALPCVPYAGKGKGLFFLPDVDTMVWIEFEAGDPSLPIWTGCLWKEDDLGASEAQPHLKFLKTDKFTLEINDQEGSLLIQNESGCEILFDSSGVSIKGSNVTVQTSGGREISLAADGVSVNKGALKVS